MIRLFFAITFTGFIVGCNSKRIVANLAEGKKTDIIYGSFPSSKMDVYLPANRNTQTPFVILIHGGSWVSGAKEDETPTQDSLMAHGIASANINYRFANDSDIHYPQLLADIDSAVNFCSTHFQEWNIKKENYILCGFSAGAHLALLYGFTTNKKINAIIAESAPTDLTDTAILNYENRIGMIPEIEKIVGATYTQEQPLAPAFAASSPIDHVKNIPTLLIHGTADSLVPYSQAVNLDKMLGSKNIPHRLISIAGANHDCNINVPATRTMIYNEIVGWTLQYGK
ncbi:MAG: prolyl oligopeptidase family serine peptidase [Ginsengibacter sp.]